jgi:hypothetical protein
MTDPTTSQPTAARDWNRWISRVLVSTVLVLILAGLGGAAAGAAGLATPALGAACVLLVLMPILNVLAELVDEVRRRDWPFALAAAVVLLLIAGTAFNRLW